MSVRRTSLGHLAVHLSGLAFVGAIAWGVGASHETVGTAIVVITGIAAICWAVFGTLWWLVQVLLRKYGSKSRVDDSVRSKDSRNV